MLEVGCGQGVFGARLALGYHYLGVEPDPTSYAVARQRVAAVAPACASATSWPKASVTPSSTWSCAFEVLEHIEDDKAWLTERAGRLRPGGWLMISVPAHQRQFARGTARRHSAAIIPTR